MGAPYINRGSTIILIILSLTALLTVASGYIQPPQPDDAREHIFQLAIAALALYSQLKSIYVETGDVAAPY